jgi:hypothetical protein
MKSYCQQSTKPVGCLIATIIIYGIINVFIILFDLLDLKDQPIYQTVFLIAYALWQATNLGVSIHCAIEPEAAKSFKVYLKINEIALMAISGTVMIVDIGFWLLLHCKEPACIIIDHFCGLALLLIIALGTSGCMMMHETLRLCDDEVGFTIVQATLERK